MHICLCFIGLQRTLAQTVGRLKESLIHQDHTYSILYITWDTEDTQLFEREFPGSLVVKVPSISEDLPLFQRWMEGLQMHISWRRTYSTNKVALFRYFLQIYLWMQASMILRSLPEFERFNVVVRCRTDIVLEGPPLHRFYGLVSDYSKNFLFFADTPRHAIDKEGHACPVYLFFGSPQSVCTSLEIAQHIHKYTHNYIETREKWYPEPTLEMNIVQPESTLYSMVVGEGLLPIFLPLHVEVCR